MNKAVTKIKPLIFNKKIDSIKIISLNKVYNFLGPIRYYPPANQEWFNSIYAYNDIYTKGMTIADKNLRKIIKSYFNLYFNKKPLCSKRITTRFKRLTINNIFVSKAELKHTSSKVIITLYVYNEERRILLNRLKRMEAILFPSFKFSNNKVYRDKIFSLYKKLDIIKKEKERLSFKNWLEECKKNIVEKINLENRALANLNNLKIRDLKTLEVYTLEENLRDVLAVMTACENDPVSYKSYENMYNKYLNRTILEKEINIITYFKLLLSLNRYKFEDKFILKLKSIIRKFYNKEVEFNIVNLKAIYLNSDIFTQIISLKLQNRNNRLLTILKYFLYTVKLPKTNFFKERFSSINIKDLWVNRVKNLALESMYSNIGKDSINQLLINLLIGSNFSEKLKKKYSHIYNNNVGTNLTSDLLNYIFNNLKYKSMGGIRLEVKGRLTRRLTASRSVFKIKWKGSVKNIDSSYKGLSSVILRGHLKSNLQYSTVNSKTRNGAFGLKGWISGK
jgi:hypothetical protein